jgi:AraC-like DNA-binding protein
VLVRKGCIEAIGLIDASARNLKDASVQFEAMVMLPRDPVSRFPLLDSRHVEEMRAVVQMIFGEHRMELSRGAAGFHAHMNFHRLDAVGIYYGRYGTAIEISFPNFDPFAIGVQLRGHAHHSCDGIATTSNNRQMPPAISSGSSLALKFGPSAEHLALCVDPSALTQKLTALIGATCGHPLKFDASAHRGGPQLHSLRRLILRLIQDVDSDESRKAPIALDELQQALMISYLSANPNNYSHLLDGQPKSSSTWQVRVAEEYIEANWRQPITIEALAFLTNASARSLFYSFKATRGYSPMAFVKQIRLKNAREMLSHPIHDTSVTGVAYDCGFSNLGHFAKDYLQAFGERPSQTLTMAKSL